MSLLHQCTQAPLQNTRGPVRTEKREFDVDQTKAKAMAESLGMCEGLMRD
jgi:hypothetical protein